MHIIEYPLRPLTGTLERNDYVLGQFMAQLWVGVRFGEQWRPARTARWNDEKYFHQDVTKN